MNEGIIIYHVGPKEYQKAIDLAGQEFKARYNKAPGSIALPHRGAPSDLNFYGLPLADHPAPPGTVIMWPKQIYIQQELL